MLYTWTMDVKQTDSMYFLLVVLQIKIEPLVIQLVRFSVI